MSFEIKLEKSYNHPIEKVWRAISEAEMISAWFIQAEFEAQEGFQYTFTHESTVIKGEVKKVKKPELLVYTWIVGDPTVVTEVRWRLKSIAEGTILEIVHTGIDAYGESAANFFENFNQGWAGCLENLMTYLDK